MVQAQVEGRPALYKTLKEAAIAMGEGGGDGVMARLHCPHAGGQQYLDHRTIKRAAVEGAIGVVERSVTHVLATQWERSGFCQVCKPTLSWRVHEWRKR